MNLGTPARGWERISAWINGRTGRERGIMLATALVLVFLIWDLLLNRPLEARRDELQQQRSNLADTVGQLERSVAQMQVQLAEARDRSEQEGAARALRAAIERSDARLADRSARLIEPDQMVAVLHRLLEAEQDLELVRLVNMPPHPVAGEREVPVYRHGVELTVRGRYLALLEYLRNLEGAGWALQWERLEVSEDGLPRMRATITLSTLSLAEEWIGV